MSRERTKNTLMSRQLDLLQNLCERLRTDKRIPIEVRGDITSVMLRSRELEQRADVSVNERQKA